MTGFILYGGRRLGSLAIEAALREAGIAFELVTVDPRAGEQRSTWFTAINPRQQLPALKLPDGHVLTEGPAILTFLADSNPGRRLIPTPGTPERGEHDRWLAYFQANVYEGELRKLFPERYCDTESAIEPVRRSAAAYVERQYLVFEDQIGDGPYFFGPQFTVLDIYVWMLVQWMPHEWIARECPKVKAISGAVAARPMIAPVHSHHFG
jgi:glutathione S-transferase